MFCWRSARRTLRNAQRREAYAGLRETSYLDPARCRRRGDSRGDDENGPPVRAAVERMIARHDPLVEEIIRKPGDNARELSPSVVELR
jgi:hypothetical protein